MKVKVASDLHGDYTHLLHNDDPTLSLVLAGDLHEVTRKTAYYTMLKEICKVYKHVIITPGNHEYFGKNIIRVNKYLKDFEADISNLHVLIDNDVVIDDVVFIGGTMWSNLSNPIDEQHSKNGMCDYTYIRHGDESEPWRRTLLPADTTAIHKQTVNYISKTIDKHRENSDNTRIVVVTHHAPSWQSVAECYIGNPLNAAFVTDLDNLIIEKKPNVWIHGHVHTQFDYFIGSTNILCNPYGYAGEYTGYMEMIIEV